MSRAHIAPRLRDSTATPRSPAVLWPVRPSTHAGASVPSGSSQASGDFRGLLLQFRGRTGLTQRQLAERVGAHRRSVQDWETGVNYPTPDRLQALIGVLAEANGLEPDHELEDAQALWNAVQREARRTVAPFDRRWFERRLAEHPVRIQVVDGGDAERRQDWGDAPDTEGFVGRVQELGVLISWVLDNRCRVVSVLGIGGIGKTRLAAKLSHTLAPDFDRVY